MSSQVGRMSSPVGNLQWFCRFPSRENVFPSWENVFSSWEPIVVLYGLQSGECLLKLGECLLQLGTYSGFVRSPVGGMSSLRNL